MGFHKAAAKDENHLSQLYLVYILSSSVYLSDFGFDKKSHSEIK